MKKYKAIFFDWDGTAVLSRSAPVGEVVKPMKKLLAQGVKLAIISGTTMENIAKGELQTYFEPAELSSLFLGLGRGAFNYAYQDGIPFVFENRIPDRKTLLDIHRVSFEIHQILFERYGMQSDIVFSRPNYCKIDLMVENNRGNALFFQESELAQLKELLKRHAFPEGLPGLIRLAQETGKRHSLPVRATTDAKYLEIGITDKSDNIIAIQGRLEEKFAIMPEDCAFFGDEFIAMDQGVYGSDSYMITEKSRAGDFFDVSDAAGERPENVVVTGGGVPRFLRFLEGQSNG